jgi:hypothetical protein
MDRFLNSESTIFNALANLKGIPLYYLTCQGTDYDCFNSREYWTGTEMELIDDRGYEERPKLVLVSDKVVTQYEHPLFYSTSLGDRVFMSVTPEMFSNTEEAFREMNSKYTFNFSLNSFKAESVIGYTQSYYFKDTDINLNWFVGFQLVSLQRNILIYADCEYGSRAILKICVDQQKIEAILKRHQFKAHIL